MTRTRVEVVAAVIEQPDGRFLLAQRPAGKVYAGYWEFPGGKAEDGETLAAAIARELHEELGIVVERAYPWIVREFDYAHAAVRLNFFRVRAWHGEVHGREAQQLAWQSIDAISVAPLLPANAPVLRALQLPCEYAITRASQIGVDKQLALLRQRLGAGLKLIQVREKPMAAQALRDFAGAVIECAHAAGARVMINGDVPLARALGADGVHLTSAQLARLGQRPDLDWCAASCHSAQDVERAARLGVDFAVLGPVLATPTHPEARPLGWDGFAAALRAARLPVFALGGLGRKDLERAWQHGAQGVAMLRGGWSA